jgi:ribosome-binding protein aMBF1 (putative translation factor)
MTFHLEVPATLLDEIVERVVARVRQAPERLYLSKSALAERYGIGESEP